MHDKISYSQCSAIRMAVWPGVGASTRRKRVPRSGRGWFRWRPLLPACCSSVVGIAHCSIKAAPAPRLKHTVRITSKQHTQSTPRHSLCFFCFTGAVYLRSFSQRPSFSLALFLIPPALFLSLSVSWRSTPPAVFQLGKIRERENERMSEGGRERGRRSTSSRRTEKQHGPGERKRDKQRQRGDRACQKSSCQKS